MWYVVGVHQLNFWQLWKDTLATLFYSTFTSKALLCIITAQTQCVKFLFEVASLLHMHYDIFWITIQENLNKYLSRENAGWQQINKVKSFSEVLFLASTNLQYDKRLFTELQVQYIKIASSEHKLFWMSKQKTICVHKMFWACNFHVLNT